MQNRTQQASAGTVALTGATGFIGKALQESLVHHGWSVRSLTRRPQPDSPVPVQWIAGDLHDMAALATLVSGADAVIHCAGTVRGASQAAFDATNVRGTENLVRACTQQDRPPRFLLVSSLAARHPDVSWYAASKYRAEQVLRDHAGTMAWTVFRPTAVYGPGDREIKPLFDAMHRYGLLPMPGFAATRFSLIHVLDVVSALRCWLESPGPVPGVFELADDRPGGYDRLALAAIAQEVWGRRVRTVSLPPVLVYSVAYLNLGLARIFGYSPMLTPGKVRELLYPDWLCDNSALKQTLAGWQPRFTLNESLPGLL